MTHIELLRPAGLVASPAYSHVAVIPPSATTILIGGQNGVGTDGRIVSDDVGEQVAQTMSNLLTALDAAQATLADVVHLGLVFVLGVDVGAAYGAAQETLATLNTPPLVSAQFAPALAVPGALIELSAVAAVIR